MRIARSGLDEIERTKKKLAFAVDVVKARTRESQKGNERERVDEGSRVTNDSQILAVNLISPRIRRENVNKDLATASATLFRPAASRDTRVLARVQRHFIFAQRYRRWPAPTTWKLCAKQAAPAVRFSFPASRLLPLPLLFCYPFRPSTLVIYRGYAADARGGICTTEKTKEKKEKSGCPRIRITIVSFRSFSLHVRYSASRRDAMKRSHGSMQRKRTFIH